MNKQVLTHTLESVAPEVAKELADIAEKLVFARGMSKTIKVECPNCKTFIDLTATPPKAKLTFEIPASGT